MENGWKNLFITGPVTSPIMVSNHWLSNDKLCLHSNSMSGAFCVLPCHQLSFQVAPEREGENFGLIDFVCISKLSKKRILRYFYYDLSHCRPQIISLRSQGGERSQEQKKRQNHHPSNDGPILPLSFPHYIENKIVCTSIYIRLPLYRTLGRVRRWYQCGLDSCHF